MLTEYELDYALLVQKILYQGSKRQTRNAVTTSIFGQSMHINLDGSMPMLHARKMYPAGVLGEMRSMFQGATTLAEFEANGCNYWKKWADEDGRLRIDYGTSWRDFDGVDQLEALHNSLMNDPAGRRHLVTGWRPNKLPDLKLPCCHYAYQFYVDGIYLDMIWTQRSVDVMVGLPSDVLFAAAWLTVLADSLGMVPRRLKLDFGDCHIYQSHEEGAKKYLEAVESFAFSTLTHTVPKLQFDPVDRFYNVGHCKVINYNPLNIPQHTFEVHE